MIGIIMILVLVSSWVVFLMVAWCLMPNYDPSSGTGRGGLRWPWSKYSDPPHYGSPLQGPPRGVSVDKAGDSEPARHRTDV
jgi:hypothetical protein